MCAGLLVWCVVFFLCSDKNCYEFGVDYVDGEELRYVDGGVANRGACESLCRETEGCTHYSYFSSSLLPYHLRGSCSLRHFQSAPGDRVEIELGHFDTPEGQPGAVLSPEKDYRDGRSFVLFAPLECPLSNGTSATVSRSSAASRRRRNKQGRDGVAAVADEESLCLERDTDYWGGDLVSFKGCESAEACRAYCTHTDGCTAFTYVPMRRRCYLKWEGAQKITVVGHISGPRCCQSALSSADTSTSPPAKPSLMIAVSDDHATTASPACPRRRSDPCLYTGFDYAGHDLETVPKVVSAYKCYELCTGDSLCEVWTHVPRDQLCFLKASDAPQKSLARGYVRDRLETSPLAVTGFSDCEPIYGGRDAT